MTALERAEKYAGVFLAAGRKWRMFVPVDATVRGDTVYLQGVQMRPVDADTWELTENAETWTVRTAEKAPR